MKKAVLFDFDGTLANTLPLVIFCFKEVFREYAGTDYTDQQIFGMFGPPEQGILEGVIPHEYVNQAVAAFYNLYQQHHARLVEDSAPISYMLRALYDDGIRLGIYTGKGQRSMDISRRFLSFCDYFGVVVTGDDVVQPKPNPEGILSCLKALDAAPREAVYVGDSNTDIMAGRAAGVTTIGVQWMPTTQSRRFDTNPDFVFADAEKFLCTIRGL